MAAVPVTISGVLVDKHGRTIQQVSLFGEMTRSDVGVGGGPIMPPEGGNGDKPPIGDRPGIWPGPGDPDYPIELPPGFWGPSDGRPTPPIVIPPPPGSSGPPLEVKTVWSPETGWAVVLVPTGPHATPGEAGRRR